MSFAVWDDLHFRVEVADKRRELVAEWAYQIADAMLAARENTNA